MRLFAKDRGVVVGSDHGQTSAADGGGVGGGSRTHRGLQLFSQPIGDLRAQRAASGEERPTIQGIDN